VPKDSAEAIRYFTLAGEKGYTDSLLNLGLMFYHGDGVPVDVAEAARWWMLAADKGHVTSPHHGFCHQSLNSALPCCPIDASMLVLACMHFKSFLTLTLTRWMLVC
jgi:TPR repeat protein